MRFLLLIWGAGVVVLIIMAIAKALVGNAPKNIIKTFSAILIWPFLALSKNGRQILLKDLNQQE